MIPAIRQALGVATKDLRSELRTRYALNALAMFVLVVVAVLVFATGGEQLAIGVTAGLLWTAMFFAGVTGLGRSFISEEERGTSLLLRLTVPATPIYLGKLLVNLLLAILSNALLTLLFLGMRGDVRVGAPGAFAVVVLTMTVGFAGALTITAALIARAGSKGALYPVLAFPLLLPMVLLGVDLLRRSISGITLGNLGWDLALAGAYDVGLLVLGSFLFEFLWKE